MACAATTRASAAAIRAFIARNPRTRTEHVDRCDDFLFETGLGSGAGPVSAVASPFFLGFDLALCRAGAEIRLENGDIHFTSCPLQFEVGGFECPAGLSPRTPGADVDQRLHQFDAGHVALQRPEIEPDEDRREVRLEGRNVVEHRCVEAEVIGVQGQPR